MRVLWLAAMPILLTACAPSNPVVNTDPSKYTETRIFAGECVFASSTVSPTFAAEAALITLGTELIGGLYELMVSGINAAAKDERKEYSAFVNLIGNNNQFKRCIQVASGDFSIQENEISTKIARDIFETAIIGGRDFDGEGSISKSLKANGIFLASAPDFFIELMLLHGNNTRTIQTWVVTRAFFAPSSNLGPLSGARRHVVTIGMVAPLADGTKSGTISPLVFDTGRGSSTFDAYYAALVPTPQTADGFTSVKQTKWFSTPMPSHGDLIPVTIDVTVVETTEGSEFLKKLGAALGEAKPEMMTAAREFIDEDAREKARAARRLAEDNATASYEAAFVAAMRAQEACRSAGDIEADAARNLVATFASAARTANQKAVNADRSEPFSPIPDVTRTQTTRIPKDILRMCE